MQTNVTLISATVKPLLELAAPAPSGEAVGARARVAVKVPSWFTSGAALRVAQLKRVEFLLVIDRGAVVGIVGRRVLSAAAPHEPLARSMVACTAALTPELSLGEARARMSSLGLDCLPVTSGPLLVGVVTREDLTEEDRRAAG
jgi:CBS domain-containing protein